MRTIAFAACLAGVATIWPADGRAGDALVQTVGVDARSGLAGLVLPTLPKPEISADQIALSDPLLLPAGVDPIITGVSRPKE